MVKFDPPVWLAQGEAVNAAADTFYGAAEVVITKPALTTRTASPLEAAAVAGDALCVDPWHRIIAGAYEELTIVGSRMVGTGSDYAQTEEAAANTRFWQ